MGRGGASLPRESVLKIDKDCHVDSGLEQEYVQHVKEILGSWSFAVKEIKATRTHHGRHYYIWIDPPADAYLANRLQYLLGDDSKRVDFNQARIDSGLQEWNKLFEAVGRKMRTVHSSGECE
jgi:hypothetical protein